MTNLHDYQYPIFLGINPGFGAMSIPQRYKERQNVVQPASQWMSTLTKHSTRCHFAVLCHSRESLHFILSATARVHDTTPQNRLKQSFFIFLEDHQAKAAEIQQNVGKSGIHNVVIRSIEGMRSEITTPIKTNKTGRNRNPRKHAEIHTKRMQTDLGKMAMKWNKKPKKVDKNE